MKKIETIWHYILMRALTDGVFRHTQQDVAKLFSFSLSTVNYALATPTAIGAIRKESKFFVLADVMKLLYYWASVRNLKRRIIYQTFTPVPVQQIESLAQPTSIFACYGAAKMILGEASADYAAVYFYENLANLTGVKNRFPPDAHSPSNVFVLAKPRFMEPYGQITTLPLTFVDIWNLSDWYAKDFTNALEEKIHAILSRPHH